MDKVTELAGHSAELMYRRMQEIAYNNCSQEGRCFKHCGKKQECINKATVTWFWAGITKWN